MTKFHLPMGDIRHAFPQFLDIRELDSGGQKLVYRAVDASGRVYALKIVKQQQDPSLERVVREIRATAQLTGPFFPTIHKAGGREIQGHRYMFIIEEFIYGETLTRIIEQQGALPYPLIRNVGRTLLVALAEIEKANMVHRDIKPDNIMIGNEDRVVLIDFGIARHLDEKSVTSSYALFGPMTIGYAAPEQIRNEKRQISIRTDLFAVGVVLYEMATGRNPFRDGCASDQEILDRCLRFDPPPLRTLGHWSGLSDFVQTCISKAAHRRPASAGSALRIFETIDWGH